MLINPTEVKIGSDRRRQDLQNIQDFAIHMKKEGDFLGIKHNTVPIQITKDNCLIAGERRTRACQYIKENLDPDWCVLAEVTLVDISISGRQAILEIIENKRRAQFTWQEDAKATRDMHEILRQEHGTTNIRATAKELGMGHAMAGYDINIANAIEKSPELFTKCTSKQDAIKVIKDNRIKVLTAELAKRQVTTSNNTQVDSLLFKGDCCELITQFPPSSIYGIIADPMYGVDIQDRSQGANVTSYDDSTSTFRKTMDDFAAKCDKVLCPNAIVCMFTAMDNVKYLNDLWTSYGFRMDPVPMIWHKVGSHATRDAAHYFGKAYEFIVYGTRGNAVLLSSGAPNVLAYPPISGTMREHAFEKPLELMEELLIRFCLPGQTILDFMAGSGKTIIAGIKRGRKVIGFEIDEHNYNNAKLLITQAIKAKDAGLLETIK